MTDRELRKIAKRVTSQRVGFQRVDKWGSLKPLKKGQVIKPDALVALTSRSELTKMDEGWLLAGEHHLKEGDVVGIPEEGDVVGILGPDPAKPIAATLTNLCHFLLHLFLPRCDRQIVERDLEEQFEEEASDLRLGPRQARLLYCKRVTDNVLAYTWGRLPKRGRITIVSLITAWVLKSFGLVPMLAILKDLGVLPWK
jgi:hypothetical protein